LFRAGSSNLDGTPQRVAFSRSLQAADGLEGRKMLITLMLVCAVFASLALGVLAAYGICLGFFRLMAGRAAVPAGRPLDTAPVKAEI
jgi:nitrate reductase NapE component